VIGTSSGWFTLCGLLRMTSGGPVCLLVPGRTRVGFGVLLEVPLGEGPLADGSAWTVGGGNEVVEDEGE